MVTLISVSIFILFCCNAFANVWGASMKGEGDDCLNCSERKAILPVEHLRQLRMEYVKRQILNKLKMLDPPLKNLPKPYFDPLILLENLDETQAKDEIPAKRESVVVYPKEEETSCVGIEAEHCIRFDFILTDDSLMDDIQVAELWLFTRHFKKFLKFTQVVIDSTGNVDRIIELKNEIGKNEDTWVKFKLSIDSLKSTVTEDRALVLQMTYANDDIHETLIGVRGEEKPFLIIQGMKNGSPNRIRRSTPTCNEGDKSCCKESFYLNFTEIGWDNWILYPQGYYANFCRGRCLQILSTTRSEHSTVVLNYINQNKGIAEEIGLSLCCTPSTMLPISMIFRGDNDTIYRQILDNMIVDECECS